MTYYSEWLQSLKPDDQVAVSLYTLSEYPRYVLHTVQRITATQIILNNGVRYRKKNGWPLGVTYGERLLPYTDQVKHANEFAILVDKTLPLLVKSHNLIKEGIELEFKTELENLLQSLILFRDRIEKRE